MRRIGSVDVRGEDVDPQTRCAHYSGERDVVALKFACCETYYPCYRCHEAGANHEAAVWPVGSEGERAVLCGACESELSIREYLTGDATCAECGAAFNPGCANHFHRYFSRELVESVRSSGTSRG
jgi:uncharacterized CHY-type Zn-finger protein